MLRVGAGRRKLIRGGRVTSLGEIYFGAAGTLPPRGYNYGAVPYRPAGLRTEMIDTPNGARMVRRWNPVTSTWQYSALGKEYYRTDREEVVVHVPVTIYGKRYNNTEYTIAGHMPHTSEGVTQIYRPNGDMAEVKRAVLAEYAGNRLYKGALVLHEASEEIWGYRATGPWRISVMNTRPSDEGFDVNVVLERPLGAALRTTRLDKALVLPEALEMRDDHTCVIRQMSVVLELSHESLAEAFEAIQPGWRDVGITSTSILQYARENHITTTVLHNDGLLAKYKPERGFRKHSRAMTYQVEGSHALFYKNPRVMITKDPPKRKLRTEAHPHEAVFKAYQGEEDGVFYFDDLDFLRREFLEGGRCPKVTVSAPHVLKSLTVGKCVIKKDPPNGNQVRDWLKKLNLPWCGDGLPSASLRVLLHLLRPKRKSLSDLAKEQLKQSQGGRCADCHAPLARDEEYHHKIPLMDSVSKQDFVALCKECHQVYTWSQDGPRSLNVLESTFQQSVYEAYVESPKTRATVMEPHPHLAYRGDPLLLDVVRCRRNALLEAPFDWAIFTPLDEIVPAEPGTLYDLSFVQRDIKWTGDKLISMMPFQGDGWYAAIAVQYLLSRGIIGWQHITHGLNATAHLPRDILREPLQIMEEAWEGDRDMAKASINSMIGLMCIEEASLWLVKSLLIDEGTVSGWGVKTTSEFNDGNDHVVDFYFQTVLDSTGRSMRPIHDVALQTESTRLAQAVEIIKSLGTPQRDICTFKTDSIGFYCRRKRKAECLSIASTTFKSLAAPKGAFQLCGVTSTESMECVYRVEEKMAPLKTKWSFPTIRATPPRVEPYTWTTHQPDTALSHVLDGGSLCITGHAGSGKTYLTNQLVEALREKGERVVCLAKTHVACSLLGGETVNRFVHKHILAGSFKGVIVVDEMSMLEFKLWGFLYRLAPSCRFICVGQWCQFPPVGGHTFLDTHLPDDCVQKSRMFHSMCGGNLFELTTCMRSDTQLYDWYTSLCPGGSRYSTPFEEVLVEARETFTCHAPADWVLCIDHSNRVSLNRQRNAALKPEGATWVKVPKMSCPNEPQDFWLYPGQVLIAHIQAAKGGVKNGLMYTVKSVAEGSVEFEAPSAREPGSHGGLTLKLDFVAKHMRLSHCLTISSSQGRTLGGKVAILSQHKRFTRLHLMVCLSRATQASLVRVI